MAPRDAREAEPSEPEGTLNLVEAIQQVLRTRELLNESQGRVHSLEKQRSFTRQRTLLEVLDTELNALKETIRRTAFEADRMAKFFSEMKIVVNGRTIIAEDALKILISLKQHADGMANLSKTFEVETMGNHRLEHSYLVAKGAIEQCAIDWRDELAAFGLILEGIKIPDRSSELFQCVWLDRNSTVRMYIKWNATEKRWVTDQGVEPSDRRLVQFMKDASQLTSTQGLPEGFEAWIDCTTDEQGQVTFRIRTRSTPDAYSADPGPGFGGTLPHDAGPSGGQRAGSPRVRVNWGGHSSGNSGTGFSG